MIIPMTAYQRRSIMAKAAQLGLDDQERHDFVERILPNRDTGSISGLTASQARRVDDALTGALTSYALAHLRQRKTI